MFEASNEPVKTSFGSSDRINSLGGTGKYLGRLTQAYDVESSGSKGMQLNFVSNDAKELSVIIWYFSKNQLQPDCKDTTIEWATRQRKLIGQLVSAAGLSSMQSQPMIVDKWNKDLKAMAKQQVNGYPQVINALDQSLTKPVGIVVQVNEEMGQSKNSTGIYVNDETKPTRFNAEIIGFFPASKFDEIDVLKMKDKLLKPSASVKPVAQQKTTHVPPSSEFMADDEYDGDSIPF